MHRNCFQRIIRPRVLNIRYGSVAPATEENNKIEQSSLPETEAQWENFEKAFLKSRIGTSPFQKMVLSAGASVASLIDPKRQDMIACLGETTGETALKNCFEVMNSSEEGKRILQRRPRINTKTVNILKLRMLPQTTLGRTYVKFLDDNNVTPDSRMTVQFIESPELAYIMTRYRESHDLVHTVLGMPTNMLGEIAVKWVEALNNGLPMCYAGAVFGALRLQPKQRKEYLNRYLPWAVSNGKRINPLMSIYWEERWEQDISDLRKELRIESLKPERAAII